MRPLLHGLDDLDGGGQTARLFGGEHFAPIDDHVECAEAAKLDPGIDAQGVA